MSTRTLFGFMVVIAMMGGAAFSQTTPPKYNVLFIISDDMKAEAASFGGRAITPNIDALAKAGVRFDKAYCQFPLCNPSRSSMLSGHYPGDTGVVGNRSWFGSAHPDFVSLPKYFKQNGYAALRSGKIFHEGIDDTDAWTEGGEARNPNMIQGRLNPDGDPNYYVAAPAAGAGRGGADGEGGGGGLTQAQRSDRIVIMPGNGETDGDYRKTTRAIELLEQYKDKPFFLAFGLSKPHSPPGAPQKFYDLYDINKIELPVDFQPRPTVPEGFPRGSIRPRNADLFIGRDATPDEAKKVIQAYLASCSYADSNVGRIIAALDRLNLREKTIIVFWGDHGYQLGEKGKWSKAGSLWEEGARTPEVIVMPGAKGNGKPCNRVVEALDFYPTLVELCGLPTVKSIEGRSLAPLLNDPAAPWDHPAYTVWSEDGRTLTGIAVRAEKWRYGEFVLGGPMLIDMENDPHQLKNLANDPKYADTRAELAKLIATYREKHNVPQ